MMYMINFVNDFLSSKFINSPSSADRKPVKPPHYYLSRLRKSYVITHSERDMYVVCCINFGLSFAKLIIVSTYIDLFPWDLDTTILR